MYGQDKRLPTASEPSPEAKSAERTRRKHLRMARKLRRLVHLHTALKLRSLKKKMPRKGRRRPTCGRSIPEPRIDPLSEEAMVQLAGFAQEIEHLHNEQKTAKDAIAGARSRK